MTNQEVFDKVAAHLLNQGGRSRADDDSMCAYRNSKGQRCAIGCLIPDDVYSPKMEGQRIGSLMYDYPRLRDLFAGTDGNLLYTLQVLHDRYEPETWKHELRERAKLYKLDDSILNTLPDIV